MMAMVPEPPAHGAGLIVMAVVWWTVVAGLVTLCVCTYLLLARDPPAPPAPCVVGPGQECTVRTVGGDAQAYYVPWLRTAALASATPGTGGKP